MRIGFIAHRDVPNFNYRATGPAYALERAGHKVEVTFVQPDNPRVDVERLRRCDVVHVYRLTNKETIACLDDLQAHGVALTWDNDDDIRLLTGEARRQARIPALQAEGDFRNQPKLFRRTDLVTTTSPLLAERFGAFGAPEVHQIPNFPQPEQYARPTAHEGFVIGWVAGLEHHMDAQELGIAQALSRILERHDRVRVVTVGVRLPIESTRYVHHRVVQLAELHQTISTFDLGIAPIADRPMNHARSDIKIKEYAAASVPWLASARGPYASYGAGEGGVLVPDDGWESAIDDLVRSRFKRHRMRRRAIAWGKTQCIDQHVQLWVAAFERAVERAQERRSEERSQRLADVGRR